MRNFSRTEKSIFAAALVLLLLFSYFLYDDSLLFPNQSDANLELIGSVSNSKNDVRRKNVESFSWTPANNSAKVYDRDSIFTGDRSEAIILLNSGAQIRVEPNSLITLNMQNGQMALNLKYGNLTGELAQGTKLKVISEGEEFHLEGDDTQGTSKVKVIKSHKGNVDLRLLSGGASVMDKNTKKINLVADQVIAVKSDGSMKVEDRPELELLTPDNITFHRHEPTTPFSLTWKGAGEISKYTLEISNDQEFKENILKDSTKNQDFVVNKEIPVGKYYWRVSAHNNNGTLTATTLLRVLNISNLESPIITSPVGSAQLAYELKPLNGILATRTDISWTAPELLENFKWQISNQADFAEILHEGSTAETYAQTPPLTSGTYYVRVQGQTGNNDVSGWSPTSDFTVALTALKDVPPDRPILITKKVSFRVPSEKDRNPASPMSPVAPEMAWKAPPTSKSYKLEISKDRKFTAPVELSSTENKTAWVDFQPGNYYFRVNAHSESGLVSPYSDIGELHIISGLLLDPVAPIRVLGKNPPTPKKAKVSWSAVPTAKQYIVEYDTDPAFSNPVQSRHEGTQAEVTIERPGEYQVRVRAYDEFETPLSDYSNSQNLSYSHRKPITAPSLLEPFDKASIFLQRNTAAYIWLEWRDIEGATKYQVEVSTSPDFSSFILREQVTENRFLVRKKLPLGKLYWRVRARITESNQTSEWARAREFTLHHQKNETFVK